MKTLKLFSILGLVILVGLTINCKNFQNPTGPEIPDPDNPSNGITRFTAEVNYTGSAVTAVTNEALLEMTLNRVWVADKLQDKDLGGWYYPDGKYVVMELKAKNVDPGGYGPFIMVNYWMFSLIDGSNDYSCDHWRAGRCFYNPLSAETIYPNEEMPLQVLVFDIPENATGLTLIFHSETARSIIDVKFNIQTI